MRITFKQVTECENREDFEVTQFDKERKEKRKDKLIRKIQKVVVTARRVIYMTDIVEATVRQIRVEGNFNIYLKNVL